MCFTQIFFSFLPKIIELRSTANQHSYCWLKLHLFKYENLGTYSSSYKRWYKRTLHYNIF